MAFSHGNDVNITDIATSCTEYKYNQRLDRLRSWTKSKKYD